jgi:hypothetical protein
MTILFCPHKLLTCKKNQADIKPDEQGKIFIKEVEKMSKNDKGIYNKKNPSQAPAMEGELEYDRKATKKEIKQGEYTKVTNLSND